MNAQSANVTALRDAKGLPRFVKQESFARCSAAGAWQAALPASAAMTVAGIGSGSVRPVLV
jgi:hypothetical protein